MENKQIISLALRALDDKKAQELRVIRVDELTVFTEFFVIATATSSTHVRALADEVEAKLQEAGLEPHHIEGKTTGWIVLDYGSVVVHTFTKDQREFYNLDKMWADGEFIEAEEYLKESGGISNEI